MKRNIRPKTTIWSFSRFTLPTYDIEISKELADPTVHAKAVGKRQSTKHAENKDPRREKECARTLPDSLTGKKGAKIHRKDILCMF